MAVRTVKTVTSTTPTKVFDAEYEGSAFVTVKCVGATAVLAESEAQTAAAGIPLADGEVFQVGILNPQDELWIDASGASTTYVIASSV